MSGLSRPFAKPLVLALLLGLCALAGPVAGGEEKAQVQKPGVPDAKLQKAIDEAIDAGARWLEGEQSPNGAVGGVESKGTLHHEIGATGLAGLALLAAGAKRGEKAVDRIHAFLQEKDKLFAGSGGRSTYDTGILIMFVTAYWRGEKSEQAGRGARPRRGEGAKDPCNMPAEDKRWVQDLTSWLIRVRKTDTCTWGYPTNRDDHSNTQYAFLGLRAARDCGAPVPAQIFYRAAQTFLERQEEDGPKVPRIILSPDPDADDYVIDMGDRARGWSYMQKPFMATGAMTTSGIAILAMCHDALTNPERSNLYDAKMERAVTQGVQDGFAWLDKNWTVKENPVLGPPWHLYYLYGLERACVFGGRDLLGRHDWYLEGARVLVDMQEGNGRWATGLMGIDDTFVGSDVVDTAWAILFLARATRPMPPIRAPIVTEGD